jgi:CheY-like chemotaxis protein/HPt (histidine-containing phosphotransfer) domain-containing protein
MQPNSPSNSEDSAQSTPEVGRSLRVLLAEDSPFNQKIISSLLRRWGHEVTCTDNGVEAVDAAARSRYDVVLMDIEMPQMDGCEATKKIREREQASGLHVPIIALTAHTASEDRDRFIQCGMNACVTKPIHPPELQQAIDRVLTPAAVSPIESTQPEPTGVAVDWHAALEGVQGDSKLLKELIEIFFEELPELLRRIEGSLGDRDAAELRLAAHRLKGCLRYFGETSATKRAFELEMRGRDSRWDGADTLFAELQADVDRMLPELRQFGA